MSEQESVDVFERVWKWIENRTGLRRLILRPQPEFMLYNAHYWLGALAVVAFVFQGITGFLLMMNYVPLYVTEPNGANNVAWQSVNNIIHNVPYGSLIASMHLYGAYAMIMIAFVHLVRNYFTGSYKKPREFMWLLGMALGVITLIYGFTGYLLPMNTVSYGATSVGVQLASYFPRPLNEIIPSILKGTIFPDNTLNNFFAFHVVLLPILFLAVLGGKIGLVFEAHGIAGPVEASDKRGFRNRKIEWYPRLILYSVSMTLLYLAALIAVSALYPISAGTPYTGGSLGGTVVPDWYFMWTDIVLRLGFFSGSVANVFGGLVAMGGVVLILVLIPWIDRSPAIHPAQRPIISILFTALIGELFTLDAYGYLHPNALPIVAPLSVLRDFLFVPAAITILGAVIYRYSPAYRVNRGRYWAVNPDWGGPGTETDQ